VHADEELHAARQLARIGSRKAQREVEQAARVLGGALEQAAAVDAALSPPELQIGLQEHGDHAADGSQPDSKEQKVRAFAVSPKDAVDGDGPDQEGIGDHDEQADGLEEQAFRLEQVVDGLLFLGVVLLPLL
jgi:hypothetical protein